MYVYLCFLFFRLLVLTSPSLARPSKHFSCSIITLSVLLLLSVKALCEFCFLKVLYKVVNILLLYCNISGCLLLIDGSLCTLLCSLF